MIKFMMTGNNDRKILGIVICKGNLEYLQDDKPIHFNAEEMGMDKISVHEIVIFYSETEEKFKEMMYQNGLISDKTIIHDPDKFVSKDN